MTVWLSDTGLWDDGLVWNDAAFWGDESAGIVEEAPQPGGYIPRRIIYVDKDGRPVDLDDVRKVTVKAVKSASKADKREVRKAAARIVNAISEQDVALMLADVFARDLALLEANLGRAQALALQRAVEAIIDDETAFLLLMAA